MGSGEWFHPRLKSAGFFTFSRNEPSEVGGIQHWGGSFKDPIQYIRTHKDPLQHAAEYSNYVADNMHMIYPEYNKSEVKEEFQNNSFIHPNYIHSPEITTHIINKNTVPIANNQKILATRLQDLSKGFPYKLNKNLKNTSTNILKNQRIQGLIVGLLKYMK